MGENIDHTKRRYGPVGHCIYCPSTSKDLRAEHIVPKSLGGNWRLSKASCRVCADNTKKFEGIVARDIFGTARAQLGLHSSTHKKIGGPRTVHLHVQSGAKHKKEEFHTAEAPMAPIGMPVLLDPPGVLLGKAEEAVHELEWQMLFWYRDNDPAQTARIESLRKQGITAAAVELNITLTPYCRMLAKIAYSASIAHFGSANIQTMLRPYILGEKNDYILHVVGGASQPIKNARDEEHWSVEFGHYLQGNQYFMTVKIELFRHFFLKSIKAGTGPTYWVVVGPADQKLLELLTNDPPYPPLHRRREDDSTPAGRDEAPPTSSPR